MFKTQRQLTLLNGLDFSGVSRLKLVFSILLSFFTLQAAALDLYVSVNGNDQWSGKLAKANSANTDGPFATIKAAKEAIRKLKNNQVLNEPITVYIQEGTYFLNETIEFNPEDSGSDKYPVKYIGKGKGAVFIGGISIEKWQTENGLWVSRLDKNLVDQYHFEQLYINGLRAQRAKTPNQGFYSPKKVRETVLEKGTSSIANKAEQQVFIRAGEWGWLKSMTGSEINNAVVTFYHKWDNTRKYIADVNLQDSSLTIKGKGMKPWNPIDEKSLYIAENFKAALDTAGEWYLEPSGKLYYMPLKDQKMDQLSAYLPTLQQLLVIKGDSDHPVSNVSFQNITFKVSGYKLPLEGQDPVQLAAPTLAAIMLDYAQGVNFINCEIANTGANAIWFRTGCLNSSISQSFMHDLGAGGVKVGVFEAPANRTEITRNITVDNCIIQSGGYIFPCAAGVAIFHAADNRIRHNDIGDFRYTGVSVGWVWGYKESLATGNIIEYNHIHHLGWGELSDMGGVYTLGISPDTIIRNNVIHHVFSYTYGGWGLYTDEGSSDIIMEKNLVYLTKNTGFHQHYGKNNTIRNNIFAFGKEAQIQLTRPEDHLSFKLTNNIIYYNQGDLFQKNMNKSWKKASTFIDSNVYWNSAKKAVTFPDGNSGEWQAKGHDLHSVIADPEFVNVHKFDFRIKNKKLAYSIGFKPFDYKNAGVYGTAAWKNKAHLSQTKQKAFDLLLANQHMKFND
ncbi:right-handed parallel beta-helix repeat-containing protein [Pedobacter nyackensis]|uniref:right-handed parallel beta-helix repeat-containing protein n=1 Tax=Pedobacter nyackensis TaxID=475255 RepID=UPI00292EC54C|nr:right-handed parallel beta-helix repeat-containing protein [Pedobacter nyackensis]